jgi:hypothetical protein
MKPPMSSPASSLALRVTSSLAVVLFAACADDPVSPGAASPDRIVVLNGVGQTGVTIASDTGAARLLRFDPFDGATMTVQRDTALSTASAFSGDLLYVAALKTGTVKKIQLPSGSNPAGAVLAPMGTTNGVTGAQFVVALRNTSRVAFVNSTPTTEVITIVANVGLCPYDVVVVANTIYSVDANLECATTFQSKGPVRLIRVDATDTTTLTAASAGAPRAFAMGDIALVFTAGATDATGTVIVPAALSRVNPVTKQVLKTVSLPAGEFGFQGRLGENGVFYVTAAAGFAAPMHTYAFDATTLTAVGPFASGKTYLALTRASGAEAACVATTADKDGKVYCIENSVTAATLVVFDATGRETRSSAVGSPAFDVTLR